MFVIIRAEYDGRPASAIPSFFRGRKYNGRLALRRGESRVTSLEARVRRLQLSERGRAMLNAGPWSCPFAPHEGQKAWKSGRSQNEGIPEGIVLSGRAPGRACIINENIYGAKRRGDLVDQRGNAVGFL